MPEKLMDIPHESLQPDVNQPRKVFVPDELARLAASISARGVLAPLRVVHDSERDCFRIITGESRWRAARLAGLKTLPCILVEGEPDEVDLLADQVVENQCRTDLKPLEFARALGKLKSLKRCTSQALAAELGISGSAITRAESLLGLPEPIQRMIEEGRILPAAAYEISRLPTPDSQLKLAHAVAAGMSRDETTKHVRGMLAKKTSRPKTMRVACKCEGVSVSISAQPKLGWEGLRAAITRLSQEIDKLQESGKDISALKSLVS